MGLSRAAIRFLVREHVQRPLGGPVLTLGRQFVFATLADVRRVCREEGLVPQDLAPAAVSGSNISAWQGTPLAGNVSDVALFRLLGLPDVVALDCSAHEGAELVLDLNAPVPSEHHGRFGLILDAGTLEHVFDARRVLMNIAHLLAPGGRVIHMSPANNYVNHGFYQFSPTFFLDYYHANGFEDVRLFVADQVGRDARYAAWDLFQVDVRNQPLCMRSSRPMLVICVARKTAQSTADRIPVQAYYQQVFGQDSAGASSSGPSDSPRRAFQEILKRIIPRRLRDLLRPYLNRDGLRRPWGFKRIGRLR
jgi:SAM-dependent methyltransferase